MAGAMGLHGVSSALVGVSRLSPHRRAKRGVSNSRGGGFAADDPGEDLRVGNVEQTLELGKLRLAHGRQMGIGEPAHDQIHLAHAAPPGAEQNPPPPLIERGTAQSRAGHEGLSMATREPPWWGLIQSSTRAAAAAL